MKEIIKIELPIRIGYLIEQKMIEEIIVEKEHKIIKIKLVEGEEFERNYKDSSITVKMSTE